MEKVLRYLNTLWIWLFAYTYDGLCTIDNSSVECFIRPLLENIRIRCFSEAERW